MSEYQAKQIAFVLDNTVPSEFPFAKLKVQSDVYATKWMDVTEEQLVAIRDLFAAEDEAATPDPAEEAEAMADYLGDREYDARKDERMTGE